MSRSALSTVVRPLLAFVALAVTGGAALAQEKPFKIAGAGVAPQALPLPGQDPRPHWVVGVATHLGLHYGAGTIQTDTAVPDPANGVITGTFSSGSPFVFTGANGDSLACNYGKGADPGRFVLTIVDVTPDGGLIVEAEFVAEFVAIPGQSTGKFAGVTGSWVMYAYTAPFLLGSEDPVPYVWAGEGRLTFKKKK